MMETSLGYDNRPLYPDGKFIAEKGKKYYKIIRCDTSRSVHAFVDINTGEVYKAASWKAPAKHARYSLLDDKSRKNCFDNCDVYTSYLYLR
jgi:hypothetical protein